MPDCHPRSGETVHAEQEDLQSGLVLLSLCASGKESCAPYAVSLFHGNESGVVFVLLGKLFHI